MDEYISRDAAIAYLETHKMVAKKQNIILAANEDAIIKFLKEKCPAVDAVPVVRCKDCKHFVQSEPYDPCECMKWTVKWGVAYVNPDDFCSYGERREGE